MFTATVKFEVKRYWMDCLLANKAQWKERAAKGRCLCAGRKVS